MSTFQNNCNSDFRQEGWTLNGSGVSHAWQAWSAIGDDTKFCSNPSNKGRACVKFPVDISSSNIADGSIIESVTIFIRAKKTDNNSRSVTVNLLCTDDTSQFTQRTVYLTTSITTQEIATYTHDPLGKPWTKDRLNRLMVQCFSYCGTGDAVRVYEVYCVINFRKKPVVVVTAPSGTVDSASPAVSWTYTQVDGDPQKFAEYKIFTADQQELASFNPNTTPAVYPSSTTYTVKPGDSLFKIAAQVLGDGNLWPSIFEASVLQSGDPNVIFPGEIVTIPGIASVEGDITSLTSLPFALAANDYYIYVRATSSRGARSDWANRTFTVTGAAPGVPGGSLGGVGVGGGGGFESVIADGTTSNVYLTIRDGSNMLAVQQADFETLTDFLGWTGTNCTLAQDTTTNYGIGSGSMSVTASSAATVTFESTFIEIADTAPITARGQIKAKVSARTCRLWVDYYDSTFTYLSSSTAVSVTDSASTWTELVATGTTPSNVAYVKVKFEIDSPANAEVHNVDHIGLMYGTNSQWSNGGHMSRNLLSGAASDADAPVDAEPWVAASASTYSRVATTGTGSEGLLAHKMLYQGVSPSISFVATGTAFTDTTTGTGFTLNKPAGVADGDVLVAYVASNTGGPAVAPPGWTLVDSVNTSSSQLSILMRDGLAADPTTWTGNLTSSATRKRAVVVAYRGAASTATQFTTENVSSSISGSLVPATATLSNTDSGAWRLSAFAVNDDTSGGSMIANTQPPSTVPPIAYVGRAGTWTSSSSSTTSFTINRPTGVQSGDLMLAFFACGGHVTVTAPSGWTLVRTTYQDEGNTDDHSGSITQAVLKRTAGASEPSSWTGTHTAGGDPAITSAVAYRNCDTAANQFIDEDGSTNPSFHLTTATVTNTDSKAWRVCAFSAMTSFGCTTTSTENSERVDSATDVSGIYDPSLAIYDSNGTISTGNHSQQGSFSDSTVSGASWIGILKPLPSAGTPPANETERQDATAGSSNPWITLAAYDSNGVATTGSQTVYGQFTPGSGTSDVSSCAWMGFLVPSSPTVSGEVGADLASTIDISSISSEVLNRAGNQVTVQAAFLGSTAGVPHLKLYAYVGNELISTQIAEGDAFGTSVWQKMVAQFALPTGTTRLKIGVTAQDRAVNDYVLFDRASLAFGSDTVWRSGTGRTAHPIFNVPVIQYAEDLGTGYGDWADLPGTSNALLKYDNLTGLCTFVDQTVVPLSNRKYRAKTISYGLQGDIFISDFGPESDEITLVADEWWLKDMAVPGNSMKLKVYNSGDGGATGGAGTITVGTTDTSAVFQPLGANKPIVVTEGYKGDTIDLIIQVRSTDYAALRSLLNVRRTLYLQSNIDQSWWVRPNGDLTATTQPTGDMHSNPLKFVTVSFVEVDPEV